MPATAPTLELCGHTNETGAAQTTLSRFRFGPDALIGNFANKKRGVTTVTLSVQRACDYLKGKRGTPVQRQVSAILLACCVGSVVFASQPSFAQQEQIEAKRKVLSKVVPAYPELARKMHISGSVKLEVIVAPNGSTKNTRAMGGHPLLVQAASDAVSKWKWAPSIQETTELIEIKFDPE